MATVRHSLIYELKGDEKDLINDLKKVNRAFDKTQANFKEGLTATSTVGAAGAAGAAGLAGGGAAAAAGATAAGTAAAVAAKKVGMLGTAMAGIKALAPALGIALGVHQVIRFGRAVENSTTQMEVWRRHFQIMGDTAKEANADLEKTIDFASATILDTGEVVKARLALRQLGVTGYRELRAVADAAQITGISITSLTDSLGRLRSGGPLQMAMRPLTKFGVSTEDFVARAGELQAGGMGEAEARTLAFTESLEAGFGGATKSMESTVESLKGTLSNEWMITMSGLGDEFRPAQKALLEAGIKLAQVSAGPMATSMAGFVAAGGAIKDWVKLGIESSAKLRKEDTAPFGTVASGINRAGLGKRAAELLGGAAPNQPGAKLFDRYGFPLLPGGRSASMAGQPAPSFSQQLQARNAQAYAGAAQARTINNITNFTQYSPVGIAPQSNLAGLAP